MIKPLMQVVRLINPKTRIALLLHAPEVAVLAAVPDDLPLEAPVDVATTAMVEPEPAGTNVFTDISQAR